MGMVGFITGISGQDGSYLAEFLLSKGYEVHGLIRRSSSFNTGRIDHIFKKLHLHYGDLSDGGNLASLLDDIRPDEIYHIGAMSHVRVSFDIPEYTGDITALGTTRLLETVRRNKILKYKTKIYNAASSELFGNSEAPQGETTLFQPQSPYAAAKLYSYWMAKNYRDAYNIFVSNGILFNHESPRRGETFVSRKITRGIANILSGKQQKITLGNIYAKRDWGFAPEYVTMMWHMLQHDKADDFVIGTGESHSVKDFLNEAFNYIGLPLEWNGEGVEERASTFGKKVVIDIDKKYFRPTEVNHLRANMTKSVNELNWLPQITFRELVRVMIDFDLINSGVTPIGEYKSILKKYNFNWSTII